MSPKAKTAALFLTAICLILSVTLPAVPTVTIPAVPTPTATVPEASASGSSPSASSSVAHGGSPAVIGSPSAATASGILPSVAIRPGCSIIARLAYSFFHASFIHALINSWCLLSIVFLFDIPFTYLIIAYLIAIAYPIDTIAAILTSLLNTAAAPSLSVLPAAVPSLSSEVLPTTALGDSPAVTFLLPAITPTVGLSAICFALLGMVSFRVQRRRRFHLYIASYIIATSALPYLAAIAAIPIASPNNIIHIYSYVAGLIVGFLNSPAHA